MKDGRTHLAYKVEHSMDLETGAMVSAVIHPADHGDTETMPQQGQSWKRSIDFVKLFLRQNTRGLPRGPATLNKVESLR